MDVRYQPTRCDFGDHPATYTNRIEAEDKIKGVLIKYSGSSCEPCSTEPNRIRENLEARLHSRQKENSVSTSVDPVVVDPALLSGSEVWKPTDEEICLAVDTYARNLEANQF